MNSNMYPDKKPALLRLSPLDNVLMVGHPLKAGDAVHLDGQPVCVSEDLPLGSKVAARDIINGEKVIKYGVPIGSATQPILRGMLVHSHNLASDYLPPWMHEHPLKF